MATEVGYWEQILALSESSSDYDDLFLMALMEEEEEMISLEQISSRRGGSRPGRAPNKDRRRSLYAQLLF